MRTRELLPRSGGVPAFILLLTALPTACAWASSGNVSFTVRFGGSGISNASSVATDSNGNIFVTGWTDTADLRTASAAQPRSGGGTDAFVVKLDPTGAVVFSTFLGGRSDDRAFGIAVDSAGNAYVTGWTYSTDFPIIGNAPQRNLTGTRNAFLTKLSPRGILLFSTYLGGGYDVANSVAVDSSGNVVLTGETTSPAFPILNAIQNKLNGQQNAFIIALNAVGTITFSTYLGGSGRDSASAVALDQGGNIYIAGYTDSSNFPMANAAQSRNDGYQTAFVAKISPIRTLAYSTYIGGGGTLGYPEMALSIDVDSNASAYICGVTSSPIFPVSTGAPFKVLSGTLDGFVVKLDSAGQVVFATYLGGTAADYATGIRVRNTGEVYIAGYTISPDFPVLSTVETAHSGLYDAFLARLKTDGTLEFSTYLGGRNSDVATALALGPSSVHVVGQTGSPDFPPADASRGNRLDAFIADIVEPPPAPTLTSPAKLSNVTPDTAVLAWNAVPQAISFQIYFGASTSPPLLTTTTTMYYRLSALQPGTYYWRVEAANPGGISTSDTWSFTVIPGCSVTLAPVSATLPARDGSGSISITAPAACAWSATSPPGWIVITSATSGTGNGLLTYSVSANTGASDRTATISIGGGIFTLTQKGASSSAAPKGDFDRNGTPDLIWQHDTTRQVGVWYMGGPQGTTVLGSAYPAPGSYPGWELISVADFDGNGVPDLVWQNTNTRQVGVWYMGGPQGTTQLGSAYPAPGTYPGWRLASVADMDGNGVPDLIWQHDSTRAVAIWFMGGAGTTVLGSTYAVPDGYPGWTLVGLADFDHNGIPDLLWQNDSSRSLAVWFMTGSGQSFTVTGSETFGGGPYPNWRVVSVFDIDADGSADLIWQNEATRQVAVWYMTGSRGTAVAKSIILVSESYPGWRALGPK